MAVAAAGNHARGWHRPSAGAGGSDGTTPARIAGGIWTAHWHPGAAQHIVQSGGGTDGQSGSRRVLDIPALQDRCHRRRRNSSDEAQLDDGETAHR